MKTYTIDISIHAPRTGSDGGFGRRGGCGERFQSTLPARGATGVAENQNRQHHNFNPRSPHGERRLRTLAVVFGFVISIHAPRTGSDITPPAACYQVADFNPRSPHGERRARRHTQFLWAKNFNPRSPHGERLETAASCPPARNFNPRSPHGERLLFIGQTGFIHNFNPRSPHGERLPTCVAVSSATPFQSTLPARGATTSSFCVLHSSRFQSTLPARGATAGVVGAGVASAISIHAPRTGSDAYCSPLSFPATKTFQSTLPARGATLS